MQHIVTAWSADGVSQLTVSAAMCSVRVEGKAMTTLEYAWSASNSNAASADDNNITPTLILATPRIYPRTGSGPRERAVGAQRGQL